MNIIQLIIHSIEFILVIYFGYASIYILVFAFAGLFKIKTKSIVESKERRFAVLIPGYKEDAVIIEVAKDALLQAYPKHLFDVVIIADSFQDTTLKALKSLPLKLVEVSFEKSTKSKALNKAMATIGDDYDVALILDADNLMKPDFIGLVNEAFDRGFKVVQGHRVAKNLNTSFAILDAISEEVNNHIFRKGHRVLGFSSALIGSGMAFDYNLFKTMMADVKAIGGFDKELELRLLKDRQKIEYLNHAIVEDEKVQKSDVFATQRKRWLSAQFIYFGRYFGTGLKHLILKGNFDLFDKVYQMIAPPRILLIGLTTLLTLAHLLLTMLFPESGMLMLSLGIWTSVTAIVYLAFVLSIPGKFYTRRTLIAILTLPKAFILMFLSLFKLKGANKKFIHTTHGIDETK